MVIKKRSLVNNYHCINSWVLSFGFVILFIICIPLGYINLNENIIFQIIFFVALFIIIIEWLIQMLFVGLNNYQTPVVTKNQQGVVGSVLFNYA